MCTCSPTGHSSLRQAKQGKQGNRPAETKTCESGPSVDSRMFTSDDISEDPEAFGFELFGQVNSYWLATPTQ
jgi:hypothetical protein